MEFCNMKVIFSGHAGSHLFLGKMRTTNMTQLPVLFNVYFRSEEWIKSLKDKKGGKIFNE